MIQDQILNVFRRFDEIHDLLINMNEQIGMQSQFGLLLRRVHLLLCT